jgi:hypothetical protein
MLPNPVQGEKITVVHQRRLAPAKILHQERTCARGRENAHHQQA